MRDLETIIIPAIEKSIIDQILELPVESIVYIHSGGYRTLTTALHRTGTNGWLSTRRTDADRGGYLNNEDITIIVRDAERYGSKFTVLFEGPAR